MRSRGSIQPNVAASRAARLASQQVIERPVPARRKRLDPQGALQPVARMRREIKQRVDLGDGHALLGLADLHDVVAGADLALPQDAKIETRPSAGRQQRRHPRLVSANAEPVAGHARLGDLEQSAADLIAVADANAIVGQILDSEVLTELANDEGRLQLFLRVAVRFDLIDVNGALLSAVAGQVALTVSF